VFPGANIPPLSILGGRSRPGSCCRGAGADLLANGVQLLHFRTGHDVDRADLGPLISHHGVLAQALDAHVANEDGDANGHNSHQGIKVHLDDHPGCRPSHAHQGDQNDRFGPMLDGKALLPFESVRENSRINNLSNGCVEILADFNQLGFLLLKHIFNKK